jgi:integrase
MVQRTKIGLREVRALGPGETIWDSKVTGFGARRQKSEAVSYIVFYRTKQGRQRWQTIGRHGAPWTPDAARDEALRLLGAVAAGEDPAAAKRGTRIASTVAELCDAYFKDVQAGRVLTRQKRAKKASTLISDRGRIDRHIKPLLGSMPIASVTRQDIEAFMHAVAEGKTAGNGTSSKRRGAIPATGGRGVATRSVGLLGAIFAYAERNGLCLGNPVHGVIKFADGKRERRISDDEYRRIGRALTIAAGQKVWPPAIACASFLLLTGWRRGEALGLRWKEVDISRRTAVLPDSKTGRSMRPLARAACELLAQMHNSGGPADLVFPPTRNVAAMTGFRTLWQKIAKLGDLPADVTPHVFRHSFASVAADLGYSEPTIAALIGHKGHSVTSRYVHSADAVLLAAADAVAERIERLMRRDKPSI